MNKTTICQGVTAFSIAALLGHAVPVLAAQNSDILVSLEQPADADRTTGIGVIRGWAAAPAGIDRVELFIDENPNQGTPNQVLGYGGSRNDVCSGVPAVSLYPDCSPEARPGFASAFNFNLLNEGVHRFTVRAFDANGDHNDDSVRFKSNSLGEEFISQSSRIVMPAFEVSGARKENSGSTPQQSYDIEFIWSTEAQRYVMSRIEERTPLLFVVSKAPTNLTATEESNGNVSLSWTDPTADGSPGNEKWFVVERSYQNAVVGFGEFEVIGVEPAESTSFVDEDVSLSAPIPGSYTYRVLTVLPWTTEPSGHVVVDQEASDLLLDPIL